MEPELKALFLKTIGLALIVIVIITFTINALYTPQDLAKTPGQEDHQVE